MKLLTYLLMAGSAFAGQSLILGPNFVFNQSLPNTPTNRVEFYIHDWSPSVATHLIDGAYGNSGAFGWWVQTFVNGSNVQFAAWNAWEKTGGTSGNFNINTLTTPGLYVRLQHNPATMTDTYEAWDVNGNEVYSNSGQYPSETDTGVDLWAGMGREQNFSMAWLRVHTTLVPLGSRPPVTYDPAGVLLWWKFDGTTADSSGNGYDGIYTGSSPVYVPTAYQSHPISLIKTGGAPGWTNTVSLRAGKTQTLDGTASYSESDTSAAVTCFWQSLSGPSAIHWTGQNTCSPSLDGLVFGDYLIQLTVSDTAGASYSSQADIGAVAQDDNGVVVNADPNVDALFGGMIAFGKNPWAFADQWHQQAMNTRLYLYQNVAFGPGTGTLAGAQWEQTGSGTVSYYWNGAAPIVGNTEHYTSLTDSITTTATTITVANAQVLDLSQLPTRVLMNAYSGNAEEVRICSVSGNVLTVCYDGRGQNATAWPSGTNVGQFAITGSGTHFVTDSTAPVCPAGAPGPPGPALFEGGSVTMTAGSTTVTTTATNWDGTYGPTNSSNPASFGGFYQTLGTYLRVLATHGGVPFIFVAQLATGGAKINNNSGAAVVSGGAILAVSPYYTGSGYFPGHVHVTVNDPTGSGAVIVPNVVNGGVTSYTVTNGGSNYSNPTFVVWADMVTLYRSYPADADTGTYFGYAILNANRTLVLRAPHVVTMQGAGETMWQTAGCESETLMFSNPWVGSDPITGWFNRSFSSAHDEPSHDGQLIAGEPYSVTDSTAWLNEGAAGGVDFYGEGQASRALYYRSGLTSALTAANIVDEYMLKSPWGNRDGSGYPELFVGGMALGAFNCVVLNGGTCGPTDWSDLRAYALSGEALLNTYYNYGNFNCAASDSRDSGYAFSWIILSAIYDPDTVVYRPRWQSDLATMLAVDNACKTANNSWSNVGNWNWSGFGPNPLTLTQGSTQVTGTAIPTQNPDNAGSICYGVTTGTGSISSGSAALTVTSGNLAVCTVQSCPGSVAIVVSDPTGQYASQATYHYTGSGTATLSFLWPYPYSGPVTWMSTNPGSGNLSGAYGAAASFATGYSDFTDLVHNYACIQNSSTSVTLSHPWQGATGSSYYGYAGNISGYGQQPFMLGIKTYGMQLLANAANLPGMASYAASAQSLLTDALGWILQYGIDVPTLTTNYARVYGFCEPSTIPTDPSFDVRSPGCNYGSSNNGTVTGREQDQELGNAIAAWYENNSTPQNKAFGDQLYGAVWGNQSFNTGGVYWDANSDAMNLGETNMNMGNVFGGKWYGFFAGVGNLSRWPAVRLGGVAPAKLRTVYVPFTLMGTPNAAQARLTVTLPSGASTLQVCSSSPCAVTVDARSGSVLMKVDYLDGTGRLVAQGEPVTLYVPE